MFTEERLKEDLSKCVETYFTTDTLYKDRNELTFKIKGKWETREFSNWSPVFVSEFSKILISDHVNEIKEYLKDITTFEPINDKIAAFVANPFKTALTVQYKAQRSNLKIGNYEVTVKNIQNVASNIFLILKAQYSYFYKVLAEIHSISLATKEATEAINNFSGVDIINFNQLLSDYQTAFENEETVSQFIKDLKTKLDEAMTASDFKTRKAQLELFNSLNSNHKVLQFILILNESKYVYPEFYTFTDNDLISINDKAEVEVYKIINGVGIEGPQGQIGPKGPQGDTGSKGKDGTAGVSEKPPVQKASLFLSGSYQIFLLSYLILLTSAVFYSILSGLNRREFK